LVCQALEGELIFAHAVRHQKPLESEQEGLPSEIRHPQNGKSGMTEHTLSVREGRIHAFKDSVLEWT
jgi:hypothetical protein